ncbi:hypothetical protein HZA97_05735 [Candidatus Woesearchaeota archaeon]|nr:hypothetical protein [Candidatus Woesearchaeota archaeon]
MDKKGRKNSKFSGFFLPKAKKGAIELSITGVIVLIIAITVLGLVLMFVRKFFTESQTTLIGTLSEIKDQMIKEMKESGDLLQFRGAREITAKLGIPQVKYLGIKNTVSNKEDVSLPVCYRVEFLCRKAFQGDCINSDNSKNVLVGGVGADSSVKPVKDWFATLLEWDVYTGETGVQPVDVNIKDARPGKYDMLLNVYQGNKDCAATDTEFKVWQRFPFTLEVTG